jgi:hypothetical protein
MQMMLCLCSLNKLFTYTDLHLLSTRMHIHVFHVNVCMLLLYLLTARSYALQTSAPAATAPEQLPLALRFVGLALGEKIVLDVTVDNPFSASWQEHPPSESSGQQQSREQGLGDSSSVSSAHENAAGPRPSGEYFSMIK